MGRGEITMAIYLDEQTRPVMERIIKKWLEDHPKDFVAERIQGSLETDANRLKGIAECEHIEGEYVGHKTCCTKCGSLYKPGMCQSWTKV